MKTEDLPLTQGELADAYESGWRFLLFNPATDHCWFGFSRGDLERARADWQKRGVEHPKTFYVLSDGTTRLCAKGNRT